MVALDESITSVTVTRPKIEPTDLADQIPALLQDRPLFALHQLSVALAAYMLTCEYPAFWSLIKKLVVLIGSDRDGAIAPIEVPNDGRRNFVTPRGIGRELSPDNLLVRVSSC